MSIRKFKPEPVAGEIITEIIDTAKWSPSYKNSQPWEVIVLSGAKKEALSKKLVSLLEDGVSPSPDLPAPESWPKAEKGRIDQLYQQRFEASGIDLNDPKVIHQAKKVNFNFYGAPHAVFLFQDNSLSQWSLFDLGLFAQSLMLAAHAKGVGTVPQAFVTDYAGEVKEFLDISANKRLVLGISMGYPDLESPVNGLRTTRDKTENFLKFIE
jgi:nitroreductase